MARVLEEWPGREYKWDDWLNGQVWELSEEDFKGTTWQSFRVSANKNASIRDKSLRTMKDGDKYIMQAIPKNHEPAKAPEPIPAPTRKRRSKSE